MGAGIEGRPCEADDGVPQAPVGIRARDGYFAGENPGGPVEGLLEEVGRLEDRVEDTELAALSRLQLPVHRHGIGEDHLHGVGRADEIRQQPRPAPSGDEAEEDLGQRERCCSARHGAVGAVERQFKTAADRGPVDEGEGRHVELAEPAKDVVPQLGDLKCLLAGAHVLDAREIGSDGEDERLAGDANCDDAWRGHDVVDRCVERCETGGAEGRRPRVITVVIQGDERHGAGLMRKVDEPNPCMGDDLARERCIGLRVGHAALPWLTFSQMTVPPMPSPMHIVVSP